MKYVKEEITMVFRKYFYLNDNEILTSQNFMYIMQLNPSLWKFLALSVYVRIKSENWLTEYPSQKDKKNWKKLAGRKKIKRRAENSEYF